MWLTTNTQTGQNEITTLNCLSTTLTDVSSAINLMNECPISNAKGMEKTPYTFKLTNNCPSYITVPYQYYSSAIRFNYFKYNVSDTYVDELSTVTALNGLRPVINLVAEVKATSGDGSASTPYIIE